MNRRTIIPVFIVGVLAVGAFFAAGAAPSVFAQTAVPATPSTQSTQAAPSTGPAIQPGAGRGLRGGGPGGYSDADLASALGISADQLTAAYQTANAEALKEAVAQGLITQAQADQMAQNAQNDRHFGGFPGSTIDYNALLAKALSISTDQLQAAKQKALQTSLATAVQNGTLTQDQAGLIQGRSALYADSKFQSSMKTAYESAVQQAVTDGVITQAQADQILKDQPSSGSFFGPGFGGGPHGGPHDFGGHGFGGPLGGSPNASPSQAAPTAVPSSSGSQG